MTDTAFWLGEVQGQLDTAQSVLDGVSRGLVVAEAVEATAERAAPVLRKVLTVLVVVGVGFVVYRVVSGRHRPDPARREEDGTGQPEDPAPS